MLDEGWRRHSRGTDVVVGFVETHDRPRTAAQIRDLEVIPRAKLTYRDQVFEEMDLDAILARRPARGPRRRARPHQRPRQPPREALAGRRSAARRRHRRHLHRQHPASRSASTTWSSGSPASPSARPCPTRWSGRPTRSSWSTCTPRRCGGAWPTATSIRPRRSTPPSPTTSGSATWRPCGSWPCCGSPTGSTTSWPTIGNATASPSRGRPRNGSSSPSPVLPAASTSCGGPPVWRPGSTVRSSASTCARSTPFTHAPAEGLTAQRQPARRARRPLRRGQQGRTCRRRWSISPAPRTPPSCCSAPAAAVPLGGDHPRVGHQPGRPRRRAPSTSTSSPPPSPR